MVLLLALLFGTTVLKGYCTLCHQHFSSVSYTLSREGFGRPITVLADRFQAGLYYNALKLYDLSVSQRSNS